MKKILLLLIVVIVGFCIFTAQNIDSPKWNQSPELRTVVGNSYNSRIPIMNNNVVFSVKPRVYNSPDGVQAINPSFRVHPSTIMDQAEVYLSSGKPYGNFSNVMYGSSNAININGPAIFDACYISTNGGVNWYGSDTTPCGNLNIQMGDVAPMVGKDGRLVITHLASATNFSSVTGMAAEYSTNFGISFSTPYQITSNVSVDKNMTGCDDVPTSPYYGSFYMAYSDYTSGIWKVYFSRTLNGGVSWLPPFAINNTPQGKYVQGTDICALTNGSVIVVWAVENSTGPYAASGYGIAISAGGGSSFIPNENAFAGSGIRTNSFNGWGIRVNDYPRIACDKSGGVRNNWLYVVHTQANLSPAGSDADIILNKSTDGGNTWSSGTRVNQDALNNGKVQYFPCVSVDGGGGVNVLYYDNRYWASSGDSCTIMLARSVDGGSTFTEYKICDHAFKPKGENGMSGGYMGDYCGITATNDKIWGFWMDDITGKYQAWAASIDLGPTIVHTPLGNTNQTSGTIAVNCTITPSGSGINPGLTKLYFRMQPTTTWTQVQMTNTGGINWTGNITLGGGGTYNYYLTSTDSLNRTSTAPSGAPTNFYSFTATDTNYFNHTPIGNVPKPQWPVAVNTIYNHYLVDSLYVKWYKNTPSTLSREFKLFYFNLFFFYIAPFNSTNDEVNVNDSIFYRIYAHSSLSQNIDSTPLYSFKIIPANNLACIGSGSTSSGYPFLSSYYRCRTSILYLASELTASGLQQGNITGIAFNVQKKGDMPMHDFNIKFQNTTATSISAFTNTGWTTCYSTGTSSYTVPGLGWQPITLQTPYYWNGTSNLLIDICFNNTFGSAEQYSDVYATNATGMMIAYFDDAGMGDVCTVTTIVSAPTYRDNICFTVNSTGIENTGNIIPTSYSLKQNYPNPFNPVTRINYDVPKHGFVSLKVYDILGREVRTLVNEIKSVGTYTIDFNGAELPSGVYFYKLESKEFLETKRMVLIK